MHIAKDENLVFYENIIFWWYGWVRRLLKFVFWKFAKKELFFYSYRGVYGLWFDEDLYHGRTNKCETFNNDLLTCSEDFFVKGVEAWAFIWDWFSIDSVTRLQSVSTLYIICASRRILTTLSCAYFQHTQMIWYKLCPLWTSAVLCWWVLYVRQFLSNFQ